MLYVIHLKRNSVVTCLVIFTILLQILTKEESVKYPKTIHRGSPYNSLQYDTPSPI